MKQVIDRLVAQERAIESAERRIRSCDMNALSDEEIRVLQVAAIRNKPEADWTGYERFIIAEYGNVR
jgi:hypothetical protein